MLQDFHAFVLVLCFLDLDRIQKLLLWAASVRCSSFIPLHLHHCLVQVVFDNDAFAEAVVEELRLFFFCFKWWVVGDSFPQDCGLVLVRLLTLLSTHGSL